MTRWPVHARVANSPNTRRLVAEFGAFDFDGDCYSNCYGDCYSDCYGDELPRWLKVKQADRSVAPHRVEPYTPDCNDMRVAMLQCFSSVDYFFEVLRDAFDVHFAGDEGRPSMLRIGMQGRRLGRTGRSGRSGRMRGLQRWLDRVEKHGRVWLTGPIDSARHWNAIPSTLSRPWPGIDHDHA